MRTLYAIILTAAAVSFEGCMDQEADALNRPEANVHLQDGDDGDSAGALTSNHQAHSPEHSGQVGTYAGADTPVNHGENVPSPGASDLDHQEHSSEHTRQVEVLADADTPVNHGENVPSPGASDLDHQEHSPEHAGQVEVVADADAPVNHVDDQALAEANLIEATTAREIELDNRRNVEVAAIVRYPRLEPSRAGRDLISAVNRIGRIELYDSIRELASINDEFPAEVREAKQTLLSALRNSFQSIHDRAMAVEAFDNVIKSFAPVLCAIKPEAIQLAQQVQVAIVNGSDDVYEIKRRLILALPYHQINPQYDHPAVVSMQRLVDAQRELYGGDHWSPGGDYLRHAEDFRRDLEQGSRHIPEALRGFIETLDLETPSGLLRAAESVAHFHPLESFEWRGIFRMLQLAGERFTDSTSLLRRMDANWARLLNMILPENSLVAIPIALARYTSADNYRPLHQAIQDAGLPHDHEISIARRQYLATIAEIDARYTDIAGAKEACVALFPQLEHIFDSLHEEIDRYNALMSGADGELTDEARVAAEEALIAEITDDRRPAEYIPYITSKQT